jgi:hypothetical protein
MTNLTNAEYGNNKPSNELEILEESTKILRKIDSPQLLKFFKTA